MKNTKLVYQDLNNGSLVVYNFTQKKNLIDLKGTIITTEKIVPVSVKPFEFNIEEWITKTEWKQIAKTEFTETYSFTDSKNKRRKVDIIAAKDGKTHRAIINDKPGEAIITLDNIPTVVILVGIAAIFCLGIIAIQSLNCKNTCRPKSVKRVEIVASLNWSGVKCGAKCICG